MGRALNPGMGFRLFAFLRVASFVCLSSAIFLGQSSVAQAQKSPVAASNVVDFAIDAKQSQKLFSTAVGNWEAAFKPTELRKTLKGLAKGKIQMSDSLKQGLYVSRKSSAIVRASFQLLDNTHYKPKALDRYVRAAGKLNDAINSGQYKKIPRLAKQVLKVMKVKKIRAEVRGFVPTTAKSFNGYLYTSMLFAEQTSATGKMAAPVFHQLRKEMTNMLVLFDTSKKMPKATQKLYDRLHKIRFSMGDVHDALVAKKTKDPKDYSQKQVKLSKATRKDLSSVLKSIRISKPTSRAVHYARWRANMKPGRGGSKAAPKRARR